MMLTVRIGTAMAVAEDRSLARPGSTVQRMTVRA
jgi:hypothetical protein